MIEEHWKLSASPDPQHRARAFRFLAQQALRNGEHDTALGHFTEVYRNRALSTKDRFEAGLERVRLLHLLGRTEDAQQAFAHLRGEALGPKALGGKGLGEEEARRRLADAALDMDGWELAHQTLAPRNPLAQARSDDARLRVGAVERLAEFAINRRDWPEAAGHLDTLLAVEGRSVRQQQADYLWALKAHVHAGRDVTPMFEEAAGFVEVGAGHDPTLALDIGRALQVAVAYSNLRRDEATGVGLAELDALRLSPVHGAAFPQALACISSLARARCSPARRRPPMGSSTGRSKS